MVLEEKRKPWFKPLGKFVGGLVGGAVDIHSIYTVRVCACTCVHTHTVGGVGGRCEVDSILI